MVTEIDKAAEAMREQIGNMTKNFNLPDVDISAMIETQRRISTRCPRRLS
jgi:hypothetical protein